MLRLVTAIMLSVLIYLMCNKMILTKKRLSAAIGNKTGLIFLFIIIIIIEVLLRIVLRRE